MLSVCAVSLNERLLIEYCN